MRLVNIIVLILLAFIIGCKSNNNDSDDGRYSYDYTNDPYYDQYNTNSSQQWQGNINGYEVSGIIYCPVQTGAWDSQVVFQSCMNNSSPAIYFNGNLYNPEFFSYEMQRYYNMDCAGYYGYVVECSSFDAWFCSVSGFSSARFYAPGGGLFGGFCSDNGFFNSTYNAYSGKSFNGGFNAGGNIYLSW